ncbi:MAG: DUF58 domain-containing protein [Myxococcales bacterium]|nr:DUF58 domain-containing protein [Myxococcales bacterium]
MMTDTAERTRETLLSAAFVRELELLRRRLEQRARSGAGGEHLSRRRGGSSEFQEHRPYAPGDDLRRIDWAAYARSGEPVVKTFRAEEDSVVRLVIDASASLDFGTPTKLAVAVRLSAALAYMALAQTERTQLVVCRDGGVRDQLPARGRGGIPGVLRQLEAIEAGGAVELARAVDTVVRKSGRPGMLVVASDFLDASPYSSALSRAVQAGHDVVLLHVVAEEELDPQDEGDLAFEDAETGALVEVTLDVATIEAYLRRFAGLCASLRAFAKKHRATYVRVVTGEALESAVRRVVSRAVD